MGELYKETLKFDEEIIKAGYSLITFWEHRMTQQMRNYTIVTNESPKQREAMFGGRTEVFKPLFNGEQRVVAQS